MMEASGPTAAELRSQIDAALDKHRNSDKKTERKIILKSQPFAGWLYGNEERLNSTTKTVLRGLRDDGFKLSQHYVCHSMAVDTGLIIEW